MCIVYVSTVTTTYTERTLHKFAHESVLPYFYFFFNSISFSYSKFSSPFVFSLSVVCVWKCIRESVCVCVKFSRFSSSLFFLSLDSIQRGEIFSPNEMQHQSRSLSFSLSLPEFVLLVFFFSSLIFFIFLFIFRSTETPSKEQVRNRPNTWKSKEPENV